MSVYNGETYLAEAIESVINQTFKSWELIVINDCSNPQKDGKNAISRATNDFFTHQEVVDGLAETAGSLIKVNSTDVKYTAITITATVDGDALKTLNISYTFAANLSLKALGAGINGKGKATNSITYTIG